MLESDKPEPPFEGVSWHLTHGHTPYQLHPVFGAGEQKLIFAGDMIPTVAHLRPAWVMAYDMRPLDTIREKQETYKKCMDDGLLLAFPHDPTIAGVALDGPIEKPIVARQIDL